MNHHSQIGTRDREGVLHKLPLLLFLAFVLVFPKGGLKIASVPITWGYVLVAVFTLAHLPEVIATGRILYLNRERWWTLIALLPFQITVVASLALLGFKDTGFAISLLAGFLALPFIFLWLLADWIERLDVRLFNKAFRIGVFLIAAYGIGLFVAKFATGHFLEVPYLTVNAGDVGHLEDKNNDRGFAFKLISTYNNGNVYGASVLMLLPLYSLLEKRRWRVSIVKLSLLLTLSRTAWIGLILNELLSLFYVHAPPLRSIMSGRVSRRWQRQVLKTGAVVVAIVAAIAVAAAVGGFGSSFLLDRHLGGRDAQLQWLSKMTILPQVQFESITEIVYLSVMNQFGLIGLLAFLLAMFTGPALNLLGLTQNSASLYKKSITCGLLIYLVIAASDGAILFIPVLLFYWCFVSLLLSRNPQLGLTGVRG